AAMAALSSCSEDGYWDQYSEADNKFSFQQSSVSYKYSSPDFPSTITVQITRDDSNGEATLPVTATTDAAGISGHIPCRSQLRGISYNCRCSIHPVCRGHNSGTGNYR
ncbi:hypothetical protein, partial [uncultured Muribaculum sp.]|uniref:hypothetical protein n=1 Tax=uncultured Muribaculum sp. TaxID=1918613 RepID=UPI0025B0E459